MEEFTIVVDSIDLLDQLRKNKERFVKSYKALIKAYEKKAVKYQKQYAEYVKKVAENKVTEKDMEPQAPMKPTDRTKTYALYIEMVEAHLNRPLSISESMFRKLWKDKWSWIQSHIGALEYYADDSEEVATALNFYAEVE